MKIWYSVQTTGLGHLTPYIALARALLDRGHQIFTLTSGPKPPSFFKPITGSYIHLNGPTLFMNNERMNYGKTAWFNFLHLPEFMKNILTVKKLIDEQKPDLILLDYEPFTANYLRLWKPSIRSFSVDHQSIFVSPMFPFKRVNFELKAITRIFSYAQTRLCTNFLDYGHQGSFFTMPMVLRDEILQKPVTDDGSILVYHSYPTAFDMERMIRACSSDRKFIFYGYDACTHKNLVFKPKGEGFLEDLAKCHIYITNCGLGSVSEALVMGKRLICQPVKGQSEQEWNARMLKAFPNVKVVEDFDMGQINDEDIPPPDREKQEWLKKGKEYALKYILGEN